MIKGIGTDIVEIDRVQKAVEKNSFLKKYFTEKELELFKNRRYKISTIAANFAAKEAVAKALGTGFSGFGAEEIEVLRNEKGEPFVGLYGNCLEKAESLGIKKIYISLSHTDVYATAFIVAEGDDLQ